MMTSRIKRNQYNADRRHERADRKVSRNVRQLAADLMAAEGIDLGEAMKRTVMMIALAGAAEADAYAATHPDA
jgi:hypothetical protein